MEAHGKDVLFLRLNVKAVIQRVSEAHVTVGDNTVSSIGRGLLVLLGVENGDSADDARWLASKIAGLRIFEDDGGNMNLSVMDIGGDIIAVSQFTLLASTAKGKRPSFIRAAAPGIAAPLYETFCTLLENETGKKTGRGIFGAHMKVSLLNDGPVTIIIDTRNKV